MMAKSTTAGLFVTADSIAAAKNATKRAVVSNVASPLAAESLDTVEDAAAAPPLDRAQGLERVERREGAGPCRDQVRRRGVPCQAAHALERGDAAAVRHVEVEQHEVRLAARGRGKRILVAWNASREAARAVLRPLIALDKDEIIAEAGITKSGFFYHFRDKNDLAKALLQRYLDNEPVTAVKPRWVSICVSAGLGSRFIGLRATDNQ